MIKLAAIPIGAAAMTWLGACTPEAAAPARAAQAHSECFLAREVNGFSPVSDTVVDVQVGANRYYRLSLYGTCPDSVFRNRVALRTLGGGTWICQGMDAEVIVPDPAGGQRCPVRGIQPITKADWLAGSRHH